MIDLITILGPTASGKTSFAAFLASELDAEIISADSRQIYRQMDIGTGKDLSDYVVNGKQIPYHLIDIADAGYKYNVYEYKRDFLNAYRQIREKNKLPILCGGTGLYLEAVLKDYQLPNVPENAELRKLLENKTLSELTDILKSYKAPHNKTDFDTAQRAIRAIEIAEYQGNDARHCGLDPQSHDTLDRRLRVKPAMAGSLIIGIDILREERRKRITQRLRERLQQGMIEEVENILKLGVSPQDLIYYGLEYKFVTNYVLGNLTYDEMFSQLEIAIHQFAKRQMTWFRGMEKRGLTIHWINFSLPNSEKVAMIKKILDKSVS